MTARALIFLICVLFPLGAQAASVRCARVNSANVVQEYRQFDSTCPSIQKGDWRWLSAPKATAPTYDASTQVLDGPTITVGASSVTETYTVRSKTAAELDADKETKLSDIELFAFQALCDHESRIRVLEGKSAITFDQCRAAIKARLQ